MYFSTVMRWVTYITEEKNAVLGHKPMKHAKGT